MLGNDESLVTLSKMMELSTEKQRITAHNLANANTPQYKRQQLEFQQEIRSALESGDIRNLKGVQGNIVEDLTGYSRLDGNNVKISQELNDMSQNGILYELVNKAFTTKMRILKSAIAPQ